MADTKISDLTTASALDGTELLLLSQGAADRKVTLSTARTDLDWVRPSDWTAMPTPATNTIHVLCAVFNNTSNYVSLQATCSGGITIDWGDGSAPENGASATDIDHLYDYADGDLAGPTTRGYKLAMVVITAQTGNNITSVNLGRKHARSSLTTSTTNWLDAQINCSGLTSLSFSEDGGEQHSLFLERVNIVACGTITSLSNAFKGSRKLQSISFPSGSLASVTNLSQAFMDTPALSRVTFPSGSLASVTNISSAFRGSGIKSISFPSGSLASVTTATNCFFDAFRLVDVSFPAGSLASASLTSIANMFRMDLAYSALRSVEFPSGSLASVTDISVLFQGQRSLDKVTFPSGSLAAVTTIANAFNTCVSLPRIDFPSGALVAVSTTTNAFFGCSSLGAITNCAIPVSFSVASCKLAGAALNVIYTSLPSVTATITVTSNHGTVDDDPTIATAKGWTVTGS